MFRQTMFTMMAVSLAAAGCGVDSPQPIRGRVATSSFPEPVTRVIAIGDDGTFDATVANTGSFELAVPAGQRYRIELQSSARDSLLVVPRTGSIDTTFYVADAGAAFDLGAVHYVHDGTGDTAVPDHSPAALDQGKGGQDTGTGGGQDTGGGGQDTGTGGGQDTGGGGSDTGAGGGG